MNSVSRKSVAEVFGEFVAHQMARDLAQTTIQTYRAHIHSVSKHLGIQKTMDDLTKKDLEAMVLSMKRAGLAHNSISSYCRVLRTFLNWCQEERMNALPLPDIKDRDVLKETYMDGGGDAFALQRISGHAP